MGSCGSRDRIPVIEGAHADEQFCFAAECTLGLQNIEFRSFQAAIKRFGYRTDLNDEHLKSIAPEINLDVERMYADKSKGQALLYLDEKFAFVSQKHNVSNLILAGWLLTKHWSDESQALELWHIMNPLLNESIQQSEALQVIKRLMYVAIEINERLVVACKDSPEKKAALRYLERVKQSRNSYLKQCQAQLDDEVT